MLIKATLFFANVKTVICIFNVIIELRLKERDVTPIISPIKNFSQGLCSEEKDFAIQGVCINLRCLQCTDTGLAYWIESAWPTCTVVGNSTSQTLRALM
jgi:hypothetical protein